MGKFPPVVPCPCGHLINTDNINNDEMDWPDDGTDLSKIIDRWNPAYENYSFACGCCGRFIVNKVITEST
ncbi:MAG: hypothetical protein OJF52_003480 [Nitrospira sp.]|jgi:hypothetical protein|nr:MAG: hypothetical protein OJF52_003480 [Nitrospira sp.]